MKSIESLGESGKRGIRIPQEDGHELAVIESEWGVSVYHGRDRIIVFGITTGDAWTIGKFLIRHAVRRQLQWAWMMLRPWRWPRGF